MPFADPTAYTKGQINRAGEDVRNGAPSEESLTIINNWRASHAYILNTFQATLRNRTRATDITVAQRLKRMRTIVSKLSRQPRMELARMDDVAGCRLIFTDLDVLNDFREHFHGARFAHKIKNAIDKYNYVTNPKTDGYRGIHDIYEYNVNSLSGRDYNGLLLELQYRTIYQHAWATTVEIVGILTENQPKFHAGDRRYVEFFSVASEIIARVFEVRNSCFPEVEGRDLVAHLRRLEKEIHVLRILGGLNISTENVGQRKNVILALSPDGELELFEYVKGTDAMRKYFELEKSRVGEDIVLVKADTGADIRMSYKNYFTDPGDFLGYVKTGCDELSPPRATARLQRRGRA